MTAVESPDFISINNTSASSTDDLIISKSVKIAEMARLSTPKPVMYLGSTTEVCIKALTPPIPPYDNCSFKDKELGFPKLPTNQVRATDPVLASNRRLTSNKTWTSLEPVTNLQRDLDPGQELTW
jgi:hypothetical protein